jgi:two-component system response regulator FixJ
MTDEAPTIYIVDDDANVRHSLAWLIETAGLTACPFASAEAFLDSVDADACGCLLLDYRMADMDGMALLDELRVRQFTLPVILISGFANVPLAVRAMRAGVLDVLEKPFDDEVLLKRIDDALRMNREHRTAHRRQADLDDRLATLTPRERAVFERVVAGETSKQIAQALGINHSTVNVHRSRTMEKLGVSTSAQLVRVALTTETPTDFLSARKR